MARLPKVVYQFKVTLQEIDPPVWRRIQVPSTYDFWQFHVAIQDAMGWLDYHLHSFELTQKFRRKPTVIGIPDPDWNDPPTIPGWTVKVADVFQELGQRMIYKYDFGDGWRHEILFEGMLLPSPDTKYPVCLSGGGACPPEDCGGPSGYEEMLNILKTGKGKAFQEMKDWLEHHLKCYWPFDPRAFDPASVRFDNPKKRFKTAFKKG